MRHRRFPAWLAATGLLALGLCALALVPAHGQDPDKTKQIADIERQIDELKKKIDDLRRQPTPVTPARVAGTLDPSWVEKLTWRSIGPASMAGRIVALAVYEADPSTYWVATASGGLLKTTNNGVTFAHQFDREATVSIGDVAVSATDPNLVWVGTG